MSHVCTHFLKYRLSTQHYPEGTRGSPPTTQVGVHTLPIPIVEGSWSRGAEEYGAKNLVFGRFLAHVPVVWRGPPFSPILAKTLFFFCSFFKRSLGAGQTRDQGGFLCHSPACADSSHQVPRVPYILASRKARFRLKINAKVEMCALRRSLLLHLTFLFHLLPAPSPLLLPYHNR